LGYITKMSFTTSGKALGADVPVSDPEDPDKKIKVVAILDQIRWLGGPTDPVEITGRLSPKNQGILAEGVSSLTGGADLEMAFTVKKFDHDAKKYFQRFHTDGKDIKFVITEGTEVVLSETPDSQISQPVNFMFRMSLTAKSSGAAQMLCCAHTADQKFVREIGVAVGV
jgi:hypothetical protein